MDAVGNLYGILGEAKIRSLVGTFYQGVRQDDVLGPLYPPDDWDAAERRLADFLVGRFGGPPIYMETRGHPRLRMRHMPFAIGVVERDRWLQLMNQAMAAEELPPEAREVLQPFFAQVADFVRNREG